MNLNVLISEEYCSVLECLTSYLNDEYKKLRSAIDESRKILLRSWDAVRVAGLKTQSMQRDASREEIDKVASDLQNFSRKWK